MQGGELALDTWMDREAAGGYLSPPQNAVQSNIERTSAMMMRSSDVTSR